MQILRQRWRKTTNTTLTTLSAIQAASQSTFINAQLYSIYSNNKNKQLTLLSQRKLALTARNTLLHYKIIGAPKKFKKWPRPLFSPKTNHTRHQKPNPSRETVPLKAIGSS